ncbi:MAG: Outer membrane protein assembly factor BamA [Planctomycetes bacterium]|nr:Outer membrane protein assembly factor BamA [Planctomycetota bacterium]
MKAACLIVVLGLFAACLGAQRIPVGASGKRLLSIGFSVETEGRTFDRDPDSASRYEITRALRMREGLPFSTDDLAEDIKYLTTGSHLFRAVKYDVTIDEALDGVRVKLIVSQPLVWRVRVMGLRAGQWSEDGITDAWRFTNRIDTAPGSEFSLARINGDTKRLYESRGFLEVRPEYAYTAQGVDVLIRVIQNQPLAGVTFSGIYQPGYRGDLIDVLGGKKRAREVPNAPDPTGLVGVRYFGSESFDFDVTTDADSASILGGAAAIKTFYEYLGFPFVDVRPLLVSLPFKFERETLLRAYPDLQPEDLKQLERAHDKGAGGKLVLLYRVYEGPKTLVGEVKFSGIENIEAVGGTGALNPSKVQGFAKEIWAVWYAMPWTTTLDRRSRALVRRIKSSVGSSYVDADALRDATLLQDYLRQRGWREGEITLKNRRFNETRTRVSLEYELRPGPFYAITDVRFEYATRMPRRADASEKVPFEAPVATLDELMDEFNADARALSSDKVLELYGTGYLEGLSAPDQGRHFGAYWLDEPLPYDDFLLTGEPDSPLDQGIEGKIRRLLAERVYSNISLEFEAVFSRESNIATDWDLPTPVRGVSLIVRIDQGHKSRVGLVTIRGNEETRDDVVRREIGLYAEDDYNRNYLEYSLNRLRRTDWFEKAAPGGGVRHRQSSRLVTRPDGSIVEYTDFAFDLIEGRTGKFNISAGYNTGSGFIASLDLEKQNFNIRGLIDLFFGKIDFTGAGQYVALKVQPPVDREQRYSLTFREPWFFGYPVEVGIGAEYTTRDFGLYSTGRAGVDPYIGWRVLPDIVLSLGCSLSVIRLFDVPRSAPEEIRRDRGSETISAFTLGFRWDTRDNQYFATTGWLLDLSYRYAGGIFGGTLDFWRLSLDAKYHIPLVEIDDTRTLVLAFNFNARWQDIHSNTERIPFSQRFLLGGSTPTGLGALRGYKYGGVGPSRDKTAIGGNFTTTLTTELRFPILPGSLYFVSFIDVGELSGSLNTYDPRGVTISGGFGIRIILPVLPIPFALDFGFPIYNQPGNREEVISINLGFGF